MPEQFDPYHMWLGIPPEEQPPNHYRLLGLRAFEANADVISNAVDQRRVFLRSVQAGKRGAQSQQLLNEVSAAGVLLLDPEKKAQYDAELRKQLSPRPVGVVHPAAAGLPDPMAPLALPGVLSQQPTAGIPTVRGASSAATSPPASRTPVILSSPPARRSGKSLSSSATMITAIVLSGAALLLILIFVSVWWSAGRTKALEGVVETTIAPTIPPGLPPTLQPTPIDGGEPKSGAVANSSVVYPTASSSRPSPAVPSGTAVAAPATQQRLALVFNGNESVQIPLPPEITQQEGDWTIETWARWDAYEPTATVLECGSLRIASRVWTEVPSDPSFNVLSVTFSGAGNGSSGVVKPGRWAHIAVVKRGTVMDWFADGSRQGIANVPMGARLTSPLSLGAGLDGAQPRSGLCGFIRDFRISRGGRFTSNFTPDSKLGQDDQTLVLLKLEGRQPTNGLVQNWVAGTPAATLRGARFIPLADNGEVAAELSDGAVDLLRTVNVATGTLEGENYQTGSHIETRALQGRSRILVPYRPPAEYDLDLELTRLEGQGGAFVGLEIAGRPIVVAIDCFPEMGRRTGVVPAHVSRLNAELKPPGIQPVFGSPGPKRVVVKIRLGPQNSVVDVQMGTAGNLSQNRNLTELAVPPEFAIPTAHGMSLGSIDAKIRIDQAILRPVTSDYSPQLLAMMRRSLTAPASLGNSQPNTTPKVRAGEPSGGRQPVPDSESLSKSEEAARKLYANELKAATKPQQQMALGNVILSAGRATQNDLTDRFVLVDLARTLFIQAGDVLEALTAARLLEIEYDIPRDQLLTSTIEALENGSVIPEHRLMLTRTAAELADAATDAQDFERAEKLATIAVQSAGKMRDSDLRKDLVERRNYIQRLMKEWDTVKVSLEKLKSNRNDAAANLEVGKFYCLSLEDFHQGLPYLAASGEQALADAAKLDIAAGERADVKKQFEAAKAWQKVQLKIVDREDKLAVQRREKWLLQQAIAGLTGVEQIEASRRLAQLQNVGPPTGRKMGAVPANPTKTKKKKT